MQKVSIMWFRRDLRLHDNAALYHALKRDRFCLFYFFDTNILDDLEDKKTGVWNLFMRCSWQCRSN